MAPPRTVGAPRLIGRSVPSLEGPSIPNVLNSVVPPRTVGTPRLVDCSGLSLSC